MSTLIGEEKNGQNRVFAEWKSEKDCLERLDICRMLLLVLFMNTFFFLSGRERRIPSGLPFLTGLVGIAGMWFGMPNPFVHLPVLVLLWPVSLASLGEGALPFRAAFFRGWLTGFLGSWGCLYWVSVPVHDIGGLAWPFAAVVPLPLDAYIGLYSGLFSGLAWYLRQANRGDAGAWRRAGVLGLGWFLLESFRGWFCTGFPWLSLASAFAPWPVWIQGASILGMYGLGGLFVGLVCLGVPVSSSGGGGSDRTLGAVIGSSSRGVSCLPSMAAAVGILAILAGGWWRMTPPEPQIAGAGSVDAVAVSLLQGNLDQNMKWEPAMQDRTVRRYLSLSAAAMVGDGGEGIPKLLIWPETAMPFDYQTHPVFAEKIRSFARDRHVSILFGAPGFRREPDGRTATFNRAYLLLRNGENVEWYEKEHLVPFGEYLPPGLDLAFLRPLLQGIGDFTPGERLMPLSIPLASETIDSQPSGDVVEKSLVLGMLICYEAVFPEIARQRVADGANVLVNISNDAWFGRTSAPVQHLQLSLFAAVEQGRWLLRSTNTGISAFVDPFGRIVIESELFRAESVSGYVVPLTGKTVYFVLGPWLFWVGAVFFMILCPCPGLRRRLGGL